MAITVSCKCGKSYQVKDQFAGHETNCPYCGKPLKIPSREKAEEIPTVPTSITAPPSPNEQETVQPTVSEKIQPEVPSAPKQQQAKFAGSEDKEICANCGRQIPPSEQACVFNGKIVCAECDEKLRSDSKPEASLESNLPRSPVHDLDDMDIMTRESIQKRISRKYKALSHEDSIICKEREKKSNQVVKAAEKRAYRPSFGGPVSAIVFFIMIVVGIPLFRTCTSELKYKLRRPRERPTSTSVEPSSETGKSGNIRGSGVLAERQEKSSVGLLPEDGIYSDPQGSGGSYEDPINGFFVVQAPSGFKIKKRLDKTKFLIKEGSSHVGEIVPQSFIQFIYANKVFVAVTARKTFTTIEHDFDVVLEGLPKRFSGIKIERHRFVTIDGVKGGEALASWRGQKLLMVKYKKHGLDHSITINCDVAGFPKFEDEFVAFLRSYRSLSPE